MCEIRRVGTVPVALNEGIWSLEETAAAIRLGACDVVVTGPLWLGGLLPLQQTGALCAAHGTGFCLHAPPSSAIAMAGALQVLATVPDLLDGSQTYHAGQLGEDVSQDLVLADGCLCVPNRPGLGIEVDEDALARLAERYAREGPVPQSLPRRARGVAVDTGVEDRESGPDRQ
jgi:glucarate dehydratase